MPGKETDRDNLSRKLFENRIPLSRSGQPIAGFHHQLQPNQVRGSNRFRIVRINPDNPDRQRPANPAHFSFFVNHFD